MCETLYCVLIFIFINNIIYETSKWPYICQPLSLLSIIRMLLFLIVAYQVDYTRTSSYLVLLLESNKDFLLLDSKIHKKTPKPLDIKV